MKYLSFFFLFMLIASCTTDRGNGRTFEYLVVNETDKDILIKAFDDRTNEITETLIEANTSIEKIYTSPSPDPLNGDLYNYSLFFGGESIIVIFDNERFLTYVFSPFCSEGLTNPLNICEYADTSEIFIFTEDFYDRAEPCDERCD